jgi:hypothetical protein
MSILIMAASLVERVLLIRILNVDVTGLVESVAADGQPDTFLFFFVRPVLADYFAVSDLYVFGDASEFDKETCIGTRDVLNTLASAFVYKSSRSKWFHFFSSDRVDDGVCLVMPRPVFVSEGDGHLIGVHSSEVI